MNGRGRRAKPTLQNSYPMLALSPTMLHAIVILTSPLLIPIALL